MVAAVAGAGSILLVWLCGCTPGSADAALSWVSSPVRPGETVLVGGGGFTTDSEVTLRAADGTVTDIKTASLSSDGLTFRMPDGDTMEAFEVAVGRSDSMAVNMPDVWWWQGDAGNSSTPGGWLRIFGRCISVPELADETNATIDRLREQVAAAVRAGQYDAAADTLASLRSSVPSPSAPVVSAHTAGPKATRLKLVAPGGVVKSLTAVPGNTSEWDALFAIPADLAPGSYSASISNGLATSDGSWVPLEMFVSPTEPRAAKVTVVTPRVWDETVFEVDCDWGKPIFQRPCGWVGARSSAAVDAALALAAANGGGIVHLPRGQYYIDGPIVVPNGVRLRGEGTALVSVYFRETNPGASPKPGLVYANSTTTAWAVQDLTLYVSHHYWCVIYVHPAAQDWALERVRIRAVAWAMLGDPQVTNGRGNRLANFTRSQVGEVVYLNANNNYRIIDCDLLGTGIIIHTGGHGTTQGGGARYGYIARNTLWNANAAHWFDGIKEVIFEYNTIRPAGTDMSWGNNIDNYNQGYAQHVWHAHNTFQNAWAGDREIMTFDPVFGDYNGGVTVAADGVTLTTANGTGKLSASNLGGMVSVLAGAGAGQYRRMLRIPAPGVLVIDSPFDVALDSTSVVQVGPYKGMILFHRNRYEDGGAFQLYANAADVVVSEHRFARTEGLLSWGRAGGGAVYAPNIRIQFIGNVIEEGNHLWNWNATYPYPHPKTVEPYWIGVLGSDQDVQPCEPAPHGSCDPANPNPSKPTHFQGAINHLVVIQRNEILNNGGIEIRGHTTNVLVAGNVIMNSSVGVHVADDNHTTAVALVNNTAVIS